MRLVFLSHDGDYCGGAQRCLVELLKGLRQTFPDIQLYVIFPSEGRLLDLCLTYIDGYKIIPMSWWLLPQDAQVGLKGKIEFIRNTGNRVRKIISYLNEIKPDCAITNTIVIPHLAIGCKLLGIKHCWFIHEVPTVTWRDNKFLFTDKNIHKWINLLSYNVLVTSCYSKSYYQQMIPKNKLKVVNQAVELDVSAFKSTRYSHRRYIVLLIGSFDSNKGQLELLQAIHRIVVSGKDIYCYLVGADLGYVAKCKDYITLYRLENNVSIVPFTLDICKFYYLSDVLVVCSALETFGRTIVEAQKCGLPVILSNVGANPERIVNNVNGLLYEKGNIQDLVNRIETLRNSETRNSFIDNISALNLNKYSLKEFASSFVENL